LACHPEQSEGPAVVSAFLFVIPEGNLPFQALPPSPQQPQNQPSRLLPLKRRPSIIKMHIIRMQIPMPHHQPMLIVNRDSSSLH
jgi:hypothetical protein